MTPLLVIEPKDRHYEWLTFDFTEEPDIGAIVIFPAYGPDHRAGADCWCRPEVVGNHIFHNKPPH